MGVARARIHSLTRALSEITQSPPKIYDYLTESPHAETVSQGFLT